MAEVVLRQLAAQAGFSSVVEVDSAGTHANEGEVPDSRARQVAARRGYDLSGLRSRRVVTEDFVRFDRLLAMDRQNLASLKDRCPPEHLSKLGLFLEEGSGGSTPADVHDPYFGGIHGFEEVLDLCEQGARRLVATISR